MNFIDKYTQAGLSMEAPSHGGERGNGTFEGL